MINHKLGIIVPYRDRYEQLEEFKKIISYYFKNKDIKYEIIVVEQDNAKLFNRGMLLNIGFKYAEELGCDYVVFHDVDMLPIDVDYSYSDYPLHLSTDFIKNRLISRTLFDEYFGGVTLFPIDDFKKINGYSNKYWGWGYEDDDLLLRCKKGKIILDEMFIKNYGSYLYAIKFNGLNSYIRGKNIFDLRKNLSIFVSFFPDDITCNHKKRKDIFTVFSIPGYDTSISYNSFSRYNFCTFDKLKNVLYVNSNIKTNYKTNFCVTIDKFGKQINVYQDGVKIGTVDFDEKLMDYSDQKYFYLGVGDPNRRDNENFFKGHINQFAVYSEILEENEIDEISKNDIKFLSKDFGEYVSSHSLKLYYDARSIDEYKLIDLSNNRNDGEIINCDIVNLEPEENKIIKIPFRRRSTFKLIPHEENGFLNNSWKNDITRWNQLRFYNEVCKDNNLLKNDGLSNLEFAEHGKYVDKNVTRIVVGI
jgi:hypothetical protein